MKPMLLAATMVAGLLAAPAMADTKLQRVEVITSPERTEVLKQIGSGFEKANPGTTVKIVSPPW